MSMPIPIARLKSGLRIANFSSPHEFKFDDGTVLGPCNRDRVNKLMLNAHETVDDIIVNGVPIMSIGLRFSLNSQVREAIRRIYRHPGIDLCLVPLPVATAMRDLPPEIRAKFKVVRVADRVTKTIFSNKFCGV